MRAAWPGLPQVGRDLESIAALIRPYPITPPPSDPSALAAGSRRAVQSYRNSSRWSLELLAASVDVRTFSYELTAL